MKLIKNLLCISLLFLSTLSVAQSWQTYYPGGSSFTEIASFKMVQEMSNGDFVAIGSTYYLRVNSLGDTLFSKRYTSLPIAPFVIDPFPLIPIIDSTLNNIHISAGEQTSDGGFILTGSGDYYWLENDSFYSIFNVFKAFLIKTDSLGDTLWTKTFTVHDSSIWLPPSFSTSYQMVTVSSFGVREKRNGGYVLTGGLSRPGNNNSVEALFVITTDSIGNLEHSFEIKDTSNTPPYYLMGRSIQEMDDGNFYAIADYLDPVSGAEFLLIKMDSLLDTIWTRVVTIAPLDSTWGASGFPKKIRVCNDGNLIVVGHAGGKIPNTPYDAYITKLDTLGNLLWSKSFGLKGIDGLHDVRQTSDQGYIAVGHFVLDTINAVDFSNYNFFVVKLDSLGDTSWTNVIVMSLPNGDPEFGILHAVQETSDQGYIVVGDRYLIKLDSVGEVVLSIEIPKVKTNATFTPFPNPSKDHLFYLKTKVTSPIQVRVYNSLGQEVAYFQALNPPYQIELKDQISGTYFLEIMNEEERSIEQLIIH